MKPPADIHAKFEASALEAEKFERALGAFVLAWADTESELYAVLLHYAGVSDAIGRAIFSGSRARTMMDFVNNIAHNTKVDPERTANLKAVFEHLAAINFMRDKVIHHASGNSYGFNDPDTRALTNIDRVSRKDAHFVYELGSKHIEQMTDDLHLIGHHLQMHRPKGHANFQAWTEEPADASAWRYKLLSSKPKGTKKVTRK